LLGRLFLDIDSPSDDILINAFIEYLRKLTEDLHLPRLGEAGVNEEDLEVFAKTTECKNNPIKLSSDELLEILELRYR